MNSSAGNPGRDAGAVVAPPVQALLAAAGGIVRDTQARERFGDLGPAFAAAFGSWLEPLAAAMQGLEPTPRSRAAARAMIDVARLAGAFAREATRRDATHPPAGGDAMADSRDVKATGENAETGGRDTVTTGRDAADGFAGAYEHYARLAARIDDSFREFSSSPEFDHARCRAAAALLDWLEHDRAAASSIVRAFEAGAAYPERQHDDMASPGACPAPTGACPAPTGACPASTGDGPDPTGDGPDSADGGPDPADGRPDSADGGPDPAGAEVIMRDGNAVLLRYPAGRAVRATVLVVPGFTTGARLFDFDPRCSFTGVLADHGVETCLFDWGRPDETDRRRTVADQLRRIDRALDAARAVAEERPVALAGHFHGGLLALLHCLRYPGKAGALVTFSTPAGFAPGQDPFGDWLRACGGERLAEVFGNVPGALVAALLAAASPMQWCGGGVFALIGGVHRADAVARFERARRFPPAFPGETFRQLFRAFHRADPFAGGGAMLDDDRYDPSGLTLPLLNVYARDDGIVPPRRVGTPRHACAGRAAFKPRAPFDPGVPRRTLRSLHRPPRAHRAPARRRRLADRSHPEVPSCLIRQAETDAGRRTILRQSAQDARGQGRPTPWIRPVFRAADHRIRRL